MIRAGDLGNEYPLERNADADGFANGRTYRAFVIFQAAYWFGRIDLAREDRAALRRKNMPSG